MGLPGGNGPVLYRTGNRKLLLVQGCLYITGSGGLLYIQQECFDSTVASFQQALDTVKQEKDAAGISMYERILGRYIPSIGLAQLNYLTEEWAPFKYQKEGNVTGISVEILEAVFKNVGVNRSRADVRIVPLAEGFQIAQNNTSTVLFSIVRKPEREPIYKWAGPFTKASFVLYAPVRSNITISSPEDLNKYRIGAVQASVENDT